VISPSGYGLYHPESRQPFGGAEVQLFLLTRELSADPEFQVSALTTVNGTEGIEQFGSLRLITRVGQKRLGADGTPTVRGAVSAFVDMYRTLRAVGADVYLHAGAGVEVGAYALICHLLRRRFIFVVASAGDVAAGPPNVCGPLKWLYPLGVRMADAIVLRTEEQRAMLRAQFGCDGLVIRTGHAVPLRPSPLTVKSTILWVGRMHPVKQPEVFLDLAAQMPKEQFVMVASRDETHSALCATIRSRAGRLSNVVLKEDVPWTEVGRFFEEAKLFVNTSTYEGFPNTFVQAALQAIPILSWTVDPDRVLARHRIGVCAAGAFERLLESTKELCDNDVLRSEMGNRAGAYAREYHALSHTTGRFKTLIKSLLRPG